MKKLILASSSERRREILEKLHIPFTVEASGYKEDMTLPLKPRDLVRHFALQKALAIATRHTDGIVIGADTIVLLGNTVFGKQNTPARVRATLRQMSGKVQTIITGLALIDARTGKKTLCTVETHVRFRKLSKQEIRRYARTREWVGKAGGYAIQGAGGAFMKAIEGDYHNVIGLPLATLIEELKKFGVRLT